MVRMNASQMEKLEAYYRAMEKIDAVTNDDIRKYVKKEFGITLARTYIPDLRTRLKKGKDNGSFDKRKVLERERLYSIYELTPIFDKWNPPFCLRNESQEMSIDLFRSIDVHFIKSEIPDIQSVPQFWLQPFQFRLPCCRNVERS